MSSRWPQRFGKRLVLDLDRIRAGALEQAHRARHVERIAVAGIRIDDEMAANAIADQSNRVGHLAHRNEADVGAAEPGIGNAGPRDIDRGEPGPLGEDARSAHRRRPAQ